MIILISVKWKIIEIFGISLNGTFNVKIRSRINLLEDDKIMSQGAEIAKTFNEYFINIPPLNMSNNQSFSSQKHSLEEDTTSGIIERYKDHPSINLLKSKYSCLANTFSFTPVSVEKVERIIESLDPNYNFNMKFGLFGISRGERYYCFHFYFKIPWWFKGSWYNTCIQEKI